MNFDTLHNLMLIPCCMVCFIRKLATTHFEPTDARNAFPCFDEPNMKAKFSIVIKREKRHVALANMPLQHTEGVRVVAAINLFSLPCTPLYNAGQMGSYDTKGTCIQDQVSANTSSQDSMNSQQNLIFSQTQHKVVIHAMGNHTFNK